MKFKKINKSTARKLFNKGQEIYIIPHKLSPNYLNGVLLLEISKKVESDETYFSESFDDIVEEYSYFNCSSNDVGKYPSYYIKEV